MKIVMLAGIIVSISGCTGGCSQPAPATTPVPIVDQAKRSDRELILDGVLSDVLNNPTLKFIREFYGSPGDNRFALVNNARQGVPWPANYHPILEGWTVISVEESAQRNEETFRLLGVRIDKYSLGENAHTELIRAPIEVIILNAGGSKNGAVMGGCSAYYRPTQVDGKWVVQYLGFMDP